MRDLSKKRPFERGSAIFLLFLAIAMFGLLAYAFTKGSRSSSGWLESEKSNAAQTASQDCSNAISLASKRLNMRCGNKVSMALDGSNAVAGAPTDGSCSVYHVNGGGVKPCLPAVSGCDLAALVLGEKCSTEDIIYVGIADGRRVYTRAADQGALIFCSGKDITGIGYSATDGLTNTNEYLAAPTTAPGGDCVAATSCRSLGPKWYVPTQTELVLLYNNQHVGALDGTLLNGTWDDYWSSVNVNGNRIWHVSFNPAAPAATIYNSVVDTDLRWLRCVRRD